MIATKYAQHVWLAGTAAVLLTLASLPVVARSDDLSDVSDKVDRIERDLRDLQFEVYKGNPPAESGGQAGGPIGGVGAGGGARINDMEQSLRDLRGQVETLTFQVKQLTEQLDIARKESNYRLGALEGGAPATMPGQLAGGAPAAPSIAPPPGPAPKPLATGRAPAPLTTGLSAGSQQQGAKSGTLGSMPADALASSPQGGLSPRQQYDAAMDLLSRAQYPEAQTAFRGFVAAYPADELAGPAQYWVGDIAFTQKDYQGAAKSFADVLKRYAKTARAPDAMLKLGLSLLELNQKKEGCTTLGAIKSKYPNANKAIFDRAAKRASEAKCV